MIVSVFSAELGTISDTCLASVYGAFSRGSHIFYMKVDSGRRIQRYAWFNSGYMRCVSLLHGETP